MGKPIMKFLMIGVNVVFWAFGGALLGVSIWLAVDPSAFDSMQASGMDDAMWAAIVYTMIGVGAGVFLIGFLGCCGTQRGGEGSKNIMLKLYIALVSVILLAEIVIIILTAIFWTSIDDGVREQMETDVKQEYAGPSATDGKSVSWNQMQYKWKCCGSNSFVDYKGSSWATPLTPVPYTCCVYKPGAPYDQVTSVLNYDECMKEASNYIYSVTYKYTYLNPRGCYGQLENFFDQNAAIIIGVTCGVIALQILGILFACCIMKD